MQTCCWLQKMFKYHCLTSAYYKSAAEIYLAVTLGSSLLVKKPKIMVCWQTVWHLDIGISRHLAETCHEFDPGHHCTNL